MSSPEYGEKYEKLIIVTMSAAIVLSLVAVILLIRAYTPDCKPSISTYCGESESSQAPH